MEQECSVIVRWRDFTPFKEHLVERDDQNKLIKCNLVSALPFLSLYILVSANVQLFYD